MIDAGIPALRAFVARDLGELVTLGGLPSGLSLVDVAAAVGADPDAYVRWFLGEPPKETFWCPAAGVQGFDDQVKIWFRDSVVVKIDGESPDLAPDAADTLGPPELRMDHRIDIKVFKGAEHVWASRGIALKLNRSGTRVFGLSAFPPTTPAEYRESLHDVAEYRESARPTKGKPS